jgi:hypothetical protein
MLVRLNETQRASGDINPLLKDYHAFTEEISPALVFVDDQRTIRSTEPDWDVQGQVAGALVSKRHLPVVAHEDWAKVSGVDSRTYTAAALEWILDTANRHFTSRALKDATAASVDAGQVYLSVVRTLARPTQKDNRADLSVERILERIRKIEKHLEIYGRFSVVQGSVLHELANVISKTKSTYSDQVIEVVDPYVTTIERRVESSRDLALRMALFEDGVNFFLSRKRMSCRVGERISFVDDSGETINYENLSSGEKHLLFLCCVAVLSQDVQSIIIVDEPELSLNFKWQRALIDTLVSLSGGGCQFIMATHSFEMIARHRSSTVVLEPK